MARLAATSPTRRAAAALRRRADVVRHYGRAAWCPICGGRFRAFKDAWNRPQALCWRCGSHERHRAQWLFLRSRPALLDDARALLHFAPEYCLRRRLERRRFRYVTADLDPAGVDLQLDITRMSLPDEAYDAVICSHVLEHVDDDRAALAELHRITAPGGWCLVMVPLDLDRAATYEDPSITAPEARLAAFWQPDHVRLYAPDVEARIAAAGFAVETLRPREAFGAEAMRRARLLESDWIFLATRPRPPAPAPR
jgi:SAM-dependent methyltransferase